MKSFPNLNPILEQEELYLLFSIFSPTIIIGFPLPVVGLSNSHRILKQRIVIDNLLSKGVITITEGNIVIKDSKLVEIISCISKSNHSMMFMYGNDNALSKLSSYHFMSDEIAELEEISPDQFSLRFIDSKEVIKEKALEQFVGYDEPNDIEFQLRYTDMSTLRDYVEDGNLISAKKKLLKSGLDQHDQIQFIDAIAKTAINLSIVLYRNKNQPSRIVTSGFAVFGSQNATWIVDVVDEKKGLVRAKTVSLNTLEARLDNLLP